MNKAIVTILGMAIGAFQNYLPAAVPHWDVTTPGPLGGPSCPGVAWAAKDGEVYGAVCGDQVGSGDPLIMRWNRQTGWRPLALVDGSPSSTPAEVGAMVIVGTTLYVGGYFNSVAGVPVGNIAKFDLVTETWSPIGDGSFPNGSVPGYEYDAVYAIAVDSQGKVYVGLQAHGFGGNVDTAMLKMWNGSSWESVGDGLKVLLTWMGSGNSGITALTCDGTDLFVGGNFSHGVNLGGAQVYSESFIKWDGSQWVSMSGGIVDTFHFQSIKSIAVFGSEVFATGSFNTGTRIGIARFSTSGNLLPVTSLLFNNACGYPQGDPGYGYGLAVQNDSLYVGGAFDSVGSVAVNGIAKWDGNAWSSLESGLLYQGCSDFAGAYWLCADSKVVYVNTGADTAGGLSVMTPPIIRWGTGAEIRGDQISAGAAHSLAVGNTGGKVWGWGRNVEGQLGTGWTSTGELTPVQVQGLLGVDSISAGGNHSLAVTYDGKIWSWGYNGNGQLGINNTQGQSSPTLVNNDGLGNVVCISAGRLNTSYAVKSNGTVWAWGANGTGQLGDGTSIQRPIPVQVGGASFAGVVAVAGGGYHALALKTNGTVWAWGLGAQGQLGLGGSSSSFVPVQVPGLNGVSGIYAGHYSSYVLRTNGTVRAWGWNMYGQVGGGSTPQQNNPTWISIGGLFSGIKTLAAGDYHCLAVKTNGTVYGWGLNSNGQLGDNTTVQRNSAVVIGYGLLPAVSRVAAGGGYSLSLLQDATLMSWGQNPYGQLGDGSTTESHVPVMVTPF